MPQPARVPARVVVLAGPGFVPRVTVRALAKSFDVCGVIVEPSPSRRRLVTRRAKRLGWPTVLDMLVFQVLIAPLVQVGSGRRRDALMRQHRFDDRELGPERITRVATVNGREAVEQLRAMAPDVVVLAGTRVLKRRVLEAVDAPFVNLHMGITPAYRGVHGGYHALADQRADLCGVTVHLVDSGIDTGGVLAQRIVHPSPDDTYATYPLLQLAVGLDLLVDNVKKAALKPPPEIRRPIGRESRLYHHPRASEYVFRRWMFGVR